MHVALTRLHTLTRHSALRFALQQLAPPPPSRNNALRWDLLKSFDALGKAVLAAPTVVAPLHSALEQWAQVGLAAIGVPRMGALQPAAAPESAGVSTMPAAEEEEAVQATPQRTPGAAAQGSPAGMLSPAWWARASPPRAAAPEVAPVVEVAAPPSLQPVAAAASPRAKPLPAAASGCCVIS
jgi:hypothetical protein